MTRCGSGPIRRSAALAVAACLLLGAAGRAGAGTLDDTHWNLTGTSTTRVGGQSAVQPMTATLTLRADRTYSLQFGSALFPENDGIWFQNGSNLVLFHQTILAQVLAAELTFSVDLGSQVHLELLKYSQSASTDKTAGRLVFRGTYQFNASVPSRNLTTGAVVQLQANGTRAP